MLILETRSEVKVTVNQKWNRTLHPPGLRHPKLPSHAELGIPSSNNTSSPMGNDRSPESQHNVGDTIIYDAQRQTVFNLGNFKWDHFHSISDENKTQSNISPFT